VRTSNSFAQISKLVLASVRGGSRPRADHQFRTRTLESIEERITPTLVGYPGVIPYVPPGQVETFQTVTDFTGKYTVNGDTITPYVTNNSGTAQYVTFTLYTAPGGGESTASHAYDNLLSQNLVLSQTSPHLIQPGETFYFDPIDVSAIKLTGQQKLQTDFYVAGNNPAGYAPDKPTESALNNHLIFGSGQLWDYDLPNGKR